jgi:hypothetical protein
MWCNRTVLSKIGAKLAKVNAFLTLVGSAKIQRSANMECEKAIKPDMT